MSDKKQYWYNFSFQGISRGHGRSGFFDCQIPVESRGITVDVIAQAKQAAGVIDQAAFIAHSYLGYMSEEEFRGK